MIHVTDAEAPQTDAADLPVGTAFLTEGGVAGFVVAVDGLKAFVRFNGTELTDLQVANVTVAPDAVLSLFPPAEAE